MKRIAFTALPLLLLLAVTTPKCLAAEDGPSNQQPAPQHSKLPHYEKNTKAPPCSLLDDDQFLAWLGNEPKKNAFFIFLGGFIPALIGLTGVVLTNRGARIRQREDNEHQIKLLQFEEKKKIATEFLLLANPMTIHRNETSIQDAILLHHIALLTCPDEYCCYTKGILDFFFENQSFSNAFLKSLPFEQQVRTTKTYAMYYNILIHVTRLMLNNEKIIPSHGWRIDNYEESIPLDYRKLIS